MADQTRALQANAQPSLEGSTLHGAVFMTMAEGVVCQDAGGEIIAVNPAAERILGRPAAQLLRMSYDSPEWDAIDEDGTPFPSYSHPAIVALRTGESSSNVVMGIRRGDDARIWIVITARPLRDAPLNRPVAVVTTFHDVSGRVRAEQEIRRLNLKLERRVAERTHQLESAVKDLESFSYSVSHDLRAPLRAIDNFSSILQEEYAHRLDAEGRRLIGIVRKNASTMGELIDDMLSFARAGRRDLILSDVDLAALAKEVMEGLAPACTGRNIEITIDAQAALRADLSAIRQVLANLLANAVKFTRPCASARIEVRSRRVGAEVHCSVKDNGVGFDPAYAHKLFGIFQRLHDSEEFEGTGVGLGIVKRIVDKHGGNVWAEGKPGEGATFYFSLPAPGSPGGS